MSARAPSDASTLCVSCGLCCTGSLFTHAHAEPEEVPRLEAHGLEVRRSGDRLNFMLPCRHHEMGCCGIYNERFTRCRTFRCALLKRLEAGEVEMEEAARRVEEAKQRLAGIATVDPSLALARGRAELRRAGPPRGADAGAASVQLWIEALAAERLLDRTFRNKPVLGL